MSFTHTEKETLMPDMLITYEPGDIPGNPPKTPDEPYFRVFDDHAMLLRGWEQAVVKSGMSKRYQRVVRQTIKRVKKGWKEGTTVHHLSVTALAPAFLLPGEMEVTGMTEELATEIGIDIEQAKSLPHTYPSLFDIPT